MLRRVVWAMLVQHMLRIKVFKSSEVADRNLLLPNQIDMGEHLIPTAKP
jgi:hypothetical protein